MKQYTVIWWEAAEEELLRLWMESSARSSITEASREIDNLLSAHGIQVGREVHEGLYALETGCLRVQFSVDEDDCLVRVWTVRIKAK